MSDDGFVVFDCDIGTDDAWALLMLIKGEEMHDGARKLPSFVTTASSTNSSTTAPRKYKILGVTCVHGNTDVDNASKNAQRVLASADRTDIPVYKGCGQPIVPFASERKNYFHGRDGFGEVQHEEEVDVQQIRPEHAVNAMYAFACKYPKKVDFVLVGPLTNFAVCCNMYGDEFLDKVRNVYVMGGNIRGKGNVTKSAEFNFMMDPEAAHIVLANVKEPLVILPWETCIDGDFGITLEWRLNVLGAGAARSKAIELLNRVERAVFIPKGFVNWIVCDAMLVAAYVFPQLAIAQSRLYHATVELTGTNTRAQMVLDHLRHKENNALVITEVHRAHYRSIIAWTAGVDVEQQQPPQQK